MDNSLLPIDICELVIDHCNNEKHKYWVHNKLLRRCSLVCRAWGPRSYYNLYSQVWIGDAYRLNLFIRTIRCRPELGPLVKKLRLWPVARSTSRSHQHKNTLASAPKPEYNAGTYLSFAHGELTGKLLRLESLTLGGVNWADYPPQYHAIVGRYPVVELELWGSEFKTMDELFRLVWSLRELQSLSIFHPHQDGSHPLAIPSEEDAMRLARRRRPGACSKLKHVHIGVR